VETPIISLMTDFGQEDFFVASLKGVILKINPSVQIVDITHYIRSFDVKSAAFVLYSCYKFFPEKTIFLVVVDPGVGTPRKIILAQSRNYFYVAPDNGVLSLVLNSDNIKQIREVSNKKFWLAETAKTFEGRDKMAPVAAYLAQGIPCSEFGPSLKIYKKFKMRKPVVSDNEIIGRILYVDKFGNLITNIPSELLEKVKVKNSKKDFYLIFKSQGISGYGQSYSSVKRGRLLFLAGSLGLIEIAAREESAAQKLGAKSGDEVRIVINRKT